MKRHGFIAVFLSLILILIPDIVFASSVPEDDSADSTLISAYAYSIPENSDGDGEYAADYEQDSDEISPGDYVFSFVSGQRLDDAGYKSDMLKNAVITQSDGISDLYSLSFTELRTPATFMFLIDQSDTMGQNHIEDTMDLINGIVQSYTGLDQIMLFRGSESGSIDISDPTNAEEITDAFNNMIWTENTDFYQSIDESLEALSDTMNTESSSGWAPGSVANLILITDRSPWELQSASTQIADYPEIIVHTVSIRDEDYEPEPVLLKGSTGKQIVTGTMNSKGSSGITISSSTMSAVEIASFVDHLIPYRVSLRSPLSSFSIQLVSGTNGGGATSVLKNVKMLNESDGSYLTGSASAAEGDTGADDVSSVEQPVSSADDAVNTDPAGGILPGLGAAPKEDTEEELTTSTTTAVADTVAGDNAANNDEVLPDLKPGGISIPLIAGLCCAAVAVLCFLALLLGRKKPEPSRGDQDNHSRGAGQRESTIEKPRTEPLTSGTLKSNNTARQDDSKSDSAVSMSTALQDGSKPAAVSTSGTRQETQVKSKANMPPQKSADPGTDVSLCPIADSNATKTHPAGNDEQNGGSTHTTTMVQGTKSNNSLDNRNYEPHSIIPAAPKISLQIEEIEGNYTGTATVFTLDRELLIGSDPEKCELVFTQEDIAPCHSRIFRKNDLIFIEDLNSGTGTFLDGMRLFSSNILRSGDEIGIGDAGFTVRFL